MRCHIGTLGNVYYEACTAAQLLYQLPGEFENPDVLKPFRAVYRSDDYDGTESLNLADTRARLKSLRALVEDRLLSPTVLEAT